MTLLFWKPRKELEERVEQNHKQKHGFWAKRREKKEHKLHEKQMKKRRLVQEKDTKFAKARSQAKILPTRANKAERDKLAFERKQARSRMATRRRVTTRKTKRTIRKS